MAISVRDLLNLSLFGEKMLLVEKPEAYTKFENGINTGEVVGYKYNLVLNEYNWDKISVKIEGTTPTIKPEQINEGETLVVKLEDLQANTYVQNNRVALSFKAKAINVVK
ncbi:hypothetical protein MPH47_13135 [Psychrobacillus psychrodurans]|uniref:hypothetical protein n=1 Tax=Psychrobacillus psychrodurans TaxID=126157 RepID=UPI001F4ECEA4|nr:hypothetical protein [Psychrobacillus psychrodurans]MCK1998142.1 hypothetical protein [Psychrobacillus psychrodurans]